MIKISLYEEKDKEEVIKLVLHCQNDGTRPLIGVEEQPDLLDIETSYFLSGGCFWVAKDKDKLVGSIALKNYGNGIGVLKKFFVYEKYRGTPFHLGQKLYAQLLSFAQEHHYQLLILDTPKNTERAHQFYHKAGWKRIRQEELPVAYRQPYEDSDFFCLKLVEQGYPKF